jgi:phosphatidylglycerophosphate synthase
MLYRHPIGSVDPYSAGQWLLYAAAALTLWSMIGYLRAAWPAMRGSD